MRTVPRPDRTGWTARLSAAAAIARPATVARAAFPRGNPCIRLRDALGPVFADQQFAHLFPACGKPAECPWRLALVTLLQFGENLSGRRAADAIRSRIDWKYLLGLELADPGFDASVLSEFHGRLVSGGAEALAFDKLLDICREQGLLAKRGKQRTDSTHVLGAVRALNRLGCTIEALRAALNALAAAVPEWLRARADPAYGLRRSRYVGRAKTHLQHLLTAAATNLGRLADWLADKATAQTRQPTFVRLMAVPT